MKALVFNHTFRQIIGSFIIHLKKSNKDVLNI